MEESKIESKPVNPVVKPCVVFPKCVQDDMSLIHSYNLGTERLFEGLKHPPPHLKPHSSNKWKNHV